MKKRTNWDFSEHTHKIEIFKSKEGNEIRVDHFRKGNSNMGYVKFVNDSRGLSVFGDFGNWIFCRPFHPSADGFVSDHYWNEKLKINSHQEHAKYDGDETHKEIQGLINGGLEDWGYKEGELIKCKEWLTELATYTDDELEYTYEAYRGNNPTELDYDYIPFCKTGSVQLQIIFDAFDEICKRLKV
tara:strand:- start:75 stop:632 length:558 start_codon:yes stop_codon:yes gene_type:complete